MGFVIVLHTYSLATVLSTPANRQLCKNFNNLSGTRNWSPSPPLPLHSPHPTLCHHFATAVAVLVTLSHLLPAERQTSHWEHSKGPWGHPVEPEGAGRWRHHQATTASPDQEYLVEGAGRSAWTYISLFSYNTVLAVTLVLELMHLLQFVMLYLILLCIWRRKADFLASLTNVLSLPTVFHALSSPVIWRRKTDLLASLTNVLSLQSPQPHSTVRGRSY